ncbi:hypothetical protein, partial [Candidatus Nanosynsacchari sp. TM7_ANC_38.39_G1_1]|uniref:hypothetical protein n=1 Tax=Candidatus Nanosynsacchari sp. TM7_ANC_38.39_G1_1 TaxID=1986206 RepID=UPI0013EBAA86
MPLGTRERPDTSRDNADDFDQWERQMRPSTDQGHADDFDAWEREMSPSQAHWDDTVSRNLSRMENKKPTKHSGDSDSPSNGDTAGNIDGKEKQSQQQDGWQDNTSRDLNKPKKDKGKKGGGFSAMSNLKRFGPTGAVASMLIVGVVGIGSSTSIMGSLLVAIKESIVTNVDQQQYTSLSRSNRILSRRLADEATAGSCSLVKIACRYTKPTDYQLKQLDKAGIKALDEAGEVIEKGKLVGGQRPAHYMIDGEKISAKDFKKTLRTNPKFRNAFRRAFNSRWVNWVDDAAVKFLKKIGVTKKVADKLNDKKTRKALTEATDELTKIEDKGGDKIKKEIADEAGDYAKKEAKKATKKKGNDVKLMMAQGICAAAKAPNVVVNINKSFRIAQYAKLSYTFLTAADAIKKGEATPEMVNNVATILTQTYTKNDGTIKKAATDSKLMKYTLGLGTAGSSSPYIPGVGGALATYLGVVNSDSVKTGCDLVGSTAAEVGVEVFDGIRAGLGPIGWAWVGGELLIEGLLTFDTVKEKLSSVIGDIVKTSIEAFGSWVDMKSLAEYFLGDKTKGATGTDIGDITGVGLSNSMADQASYTGNAPLTVQQKVAFDEQIVQPERIALAEEDRLTHSPFDISSPNTFLGSIAIRFVPYLSMTSSPLAFVSAISSISTSSLFNLFNPSAHAKNIIDENKCTQNAVLAKEKDIAVGPACDVQYGVPTDYMGIEPDQVASELSASGDIDEDGKVKSNSELQDWIDTCNQASIINTKECTVDSRQRALYNLYQIDKRTVDGMDEDPDKTKSAAGSGSGSTTSGPGATLPDGDVISLAKQIVDNPNITYDGDQFQNMANGQPAYTNSLGPITVDKRLLQIILYIANKYPI